MASANRLSTNPQNTPNRIAQAFLHRRKAKGYATECDGERVMHYSTIIAWYDRGDVPWVTLAGYDTVTTKTRVNAILTAFGYPGHFHHKRGKLYLGDKKVDASEPIPITGPLGAIALRFLALADEIGVERPTLP